MGGQTGATAAILAVVSGSIILTVAGAVVVVKVCMARVIVWRIRHVEIRRALVFWRGEEAVRIKQLLVRLAVEVVFVERIMRDGAGEVALCFWHIVLGGPDAEVDFKRLWFGLGLGDGLGEHFVGLGGDAGGDVVVSVVVAREKR